MSDTFNRESSPGGKKETKERGKESTREAERRWTPALNAIGIGLYRGFVQELRESGKDDEAVALEARIREAGDPEAQEREFGKFMKERFDRFP